MLIVFDKAFGTFLDEKDVIFESDSTDAIGSEGTIDTIDKTDKQLLVPAREAQLFGIMRPEVSWSQPALQLQGFVAIASRWYKGMSASDAILHGPGYVTATLPRVIKYPTRFRFRLASQLSWIGVAYLLFQYMLVMTVGILLLILPLPLHELLGLAVWCIGTLYLHGLLWDGNRRVTLLEAARCGLSLAALALLGDQLQLAMVLGPHWPLLKGYAVLVCSGSMVAALLTPMSLLGTATGAVRKSK